MNYELALKLKEAGWKFKEWYLEEHSGESSKLHWDNSDWCAPALEELIEACQSHPMNRKDIGLHGGENKWTAWARKTRLDEGGDGDRDCVGTTPTIAVAHLWLALNNTTHN